MEAEALLGRRLPAIEMAGVGGRFETDAPFRFALTGAPMQAEVNGEAVEWHATHSIKAGDVLTIRGVTRGTYGYLTPAGGIETEAWLGSRAAHLAIGIGAALGAGEVLALGDDPEPNAAGLRIAVEDRFSGGRLRLMPGPQTGLFDAALRERFFATVFRRSAQANRQGVRLDGGDAPFSSDTGGLASDFIAPGDVQMTGAGLPFVLMAECQTIGGYPRIGTVHPRDLPRLAQAPEGAELRFQAIDTAEADALWQSEAALFKDLKAKVSRRIRDPREMRDLAAYRLIDGVVRGDEG
jgi:allophanate hydrolase